MQELKCMSCGIKLSQTNIPSRYKKAQEKECKSCWNLERKKQYFEDMPKSPCLNCNELCVKNWGGNWCSLKCRFISFLDTFSSKTGCWIWIGKGIRGGYGRLLINGKLKGAHRISYQLFKGEIPNGKIVCHSCDNPPCVNPDHLWLGTMKDNMQDMLKKGRTTNKIILGKG